jgi:hypothetical protein
LLNIKSGNNLLQIDFFGIVKGHDGRQMLLIENADFGARVSDVDG